MFDTIGSITAIVVGICALGISIWQGFEMRKNYRLSVTPFISLEGNWVVGTDIIGISMKNKGIGPAKITKINYIFNSQSVFDIPTQSEFLLLIMKNLEGSGINSICHRVIDLGDIVSAGEDQSLFWLDVHGRDDPLKIQKFQEVFKKVKITVNYSSIYNDSFSTASNTIVS